MAYLGMQGGHEGVPLGETRSSYTGGSYPGQCSGSVSSGVRPKSHSHRELREPGGEPSRGEYRSGATGGTHLGMDFFRIYIQGLSLTVG